MSYEPDGYRIEVPTASVFADVSQYIALMLSALDGWLDFPSRWVDSDPDGEAHLYMEDLRLWLQGLPAMLVPVGGIMLWPVVASPVSAPPGYLYCDGSPAVIADYPELFALIGTTFGSPTPGYSFGLPDLRGRFALGALSGTYALAGTGGAATHTLTTAQLPSHAHGILVKDNTTSQTNVRLASAGSTGTNSSSTTESTGSGSAHNNMPPYLVLNYIIRAL